MKAESNLNPQAVNQVSGATGLIQFMPTTARSLGTTVDDLFKMSAKDQLKYVYEYYKPYTGKLNNYFDVYLATFFPAAIGKPDNWTFETKRLNRTIIARQNPGIDVNSDGQITVAEFKQYLRKTVPTVYNSIIFAKDTFKKSLPVLIPAIIILLAFTAFK